MKDPSNHTKALQFLNNTIANEENYWNRESSFEDVLAYFDERQPGWREAYHQDLSREGLPLEPTPEVLAHLIQTETGGLGSGPPQGEQGLVPNSGVYIGHDHKEQLYAIGWALAMSYEQGPSNMETSHGYQPLGRPTRDEVERYENIWGRTEGP